MEKILVIQMCRMGDLVQTLPLLKKLKAEHRGCKITIMCIRESMGLIQDTPLVDCFVSIPHRFYRKTQTQIERDPSLVTTLWNFPPLYAHHDLVINLTHDASSAVLCEKVPATIKHGRIQTRAGEIRTLGDWAKYLFAAVRNRTQNHLNLVDIHIGMGGVPHNPLKNWLAVDQHSAEKGRALLEGHGYRGKGPLVGLQLGASQLHRAWPIGNFAVLAQQLKEQFEFEILLLGSPGEKELGAEFVRQVNFPVINLIGQTQVTELPAILLMCDFLISNDTGTAHIAAAVGTRVLGLYFSTAYWGETAPFGENHLILQVELPCSPCLYHEKCDTLDCKQHLTVEAVYAAASMMLSGQMEQPFDYPHLSLFRSQFLSNGTLAYIPLSAVISDSYQTGFINRVLWEEALGVGHDADYIDLCLSRMGHLDHFRSKAEATQDEHQYLREQYQQALRLLHHIILEFQEPPVTKERILSLNDGLLAIQENISKLKASLMQHYSMYELMDTDFLPHPRMAEQLLKKYRRLQGISNLSATLLGGVLSVS